MAIKSWIKFKEESSRGTRTPGLPHPTQTLNIAGYLRKYNITIEAGNVFDLIRQHTSRRFRAFNH